MSTDAAPDAPLELQSISDEHRRVAFAFAQMVRTLRFNNPDRVVNVMQWVESEFGVDTAGVGGRFDTGVDLVAAMNAKASTSNDKFKSFLELITKKGYFEGSEPGTEEYESRMVRARTRFEARGAQYDNMSAEQLKQKGNTLMSQGKYREAVSCYTKALEIDPCNHVLYANRAAAYLHLKDNRSAMVDCEKSIANNGDYAKAHARLGTAHFYEGNYSKAAVCFQRALKLDPTNTAYQEDLDRAKAKVAELPAPAASGGLPLPNFEQMSQFMADPAFAKFAEQMTSNPQTMELMRGLAKNMMDQGTLPSALTQPVGDGSKLRTPFGVISREKLEQLQRERYTNPKLRQIMEETQRDGMQAFYRHIGDPEVMALLNEMQSMMMESAEAE